MKKILYVAESFLPLFDGVVRFTEDLIPKLTKVFDVTIAVPNYNYSEHEYHGAKLEFFPRFKLYHMNAGNKYNPVIPTGKLYRLVKQSDVVFVQSLPYIGATSILFSKILRKPCVMYFHQIGWEQFTEVIAGNRWWRKLFMRFVIVQMRFVLNLCDLILVPSEAMIDVLNKEGIRAQKKVLRLGVDIDKFSPAKNKASAKRKVKLDPKKLVIGYCGRISDEKDVATLVKAYKKLARKHNIHLLLVGGGDKEKEFAKKRGVTVTKFVRDVVPYYHAMDIFVLPSLTETTGLSTLEAMACGLPVVTTPVGLALTSISDGYNGLIFGQKDVKALTKQLEKVIKSRKLRSELGKNARKTIKEGFNWDISIKKMVEIFESIKKK
jgi:glycosyltransferase involved in cell wall biosynthesis